MNIKRLNVGAYPVPITKRFGVASIAVLSTLGFVGPAYADIDNSAVAVGTYSAADDTSSTPDTEAVPVIPASRDLSIVKTVASGPTTALGTDGANTDGGDQITYQYVITNDGTVSETNVTPVETGPTFNGSAGTGSFGGFTVTSGSAASLAPGASVTFENTYTLSALDVYRAAGITDAVDNSATASSDDHTDTDADTAETTIAANPALNIAKVAVLNDEVVADGLAEATETITYTYTVTNSGNVALTNVAIQDTHEGALVAPAPAGETITVEGPVQPSDIGVANDGVIDTLEAGATATFTYVHTVTQTEVDNQ